MASAVCRVTHTAPYCEFGNYGHRDQHAGCGAAQFPAIRIDLGVCVLDVRQRVFNHKQLQKT